MNELQKKLARRRSLNGELGVAPVGAEPLVEDVPLTRDTTTETRKDTGEGVSQSKASSSSQSELQAKLARRRNMNGEHNTPQKILPSTEPVHAAPVSKTEHVEQLDDSHGRERQASVSSERSSNVDEHILSDAAAANLTPAWLNSTSDTAAFDTHQNQDQNKKLSRIATESVADNCHEESPNAAAEEILPNAAMIETIAVLEIGLPCTAQEETTACAYGVESLAVETTDNIESQQATQQTFPFPAVEQLVPELPPDAQISLLVDIPGQGASSSDDAASREEKIELPPVPVSDAAVAGKVTISLALESPAAVSARDSSINPPPTDRGPGSRESPTPARVSWSPLRSSVAAIAAGVVPPASSSSSPSSSISSPRVAPQRANTTSTGGARSSNTSISPVRRTASLTGAPSPSASAKRSTWYPGKYLMEGLGSKHSTPRLKMNPELARKNYADLMSSSEKEFSSEKSSNSPRPLTSGSKESSVDRDFPVDDRSPTHMYGSSSPQQQEEALQAAAAESTDGVAAAVSVREDILDKMLELSRENGLLKKEVAMLRSEVQRQKALIALLSGENIDVLPPAAAATVSSDRNPETTEEHTEAQSGSRTTSTSNTEGAIAVGNNTSPGLSGAKARASKRFGARGFYSSYSSAEQEEGDGLFGADTDTTYGSSNNNYNLSKLALDDLGDGTGTDPQARKVSVDDAADSSSAAQSLDQLLNSGGSGSRNSKDGHPQQHHHIHHHYQKDSARALVGEKLLVQSFMSTSMVYPKPASQESEQQKGVWSERFGSLGLISSNAEVDDHLFNEENDRKAQQRAAATEAQNAVGLEEC